MSHSPLLRAGILASSALAIVAVSILTTGPAASASGTLDGISYVEPEVDAGASFTLHPTGASDPPTFRGCIRYVDDGVAGSFTFYPSTTSFGDITDSYANAGPNSWTRTTEMYEGGFSDCDALPAVDFTATVTVLPAATIDATLLAQESVNGTDSSDATISLDFFDPTSGMGWEVDESGVCGETGDMPAGLSLDTTWSADNVVPPVSISGTPAAATQGTHAVCLALVDDNGERGFAVLTIDIEAPPALADTGADTSSAWLGFFVSGIAVVTGTLFVLRNRLRNA